MRTRERILMIRLIEKAAKHPNYTKHLIMGAPDSKLAADAAQFLVIHAQSTSSAASDNEDSVPA